MCLLLQAELKYGLSVHSVKFDDFERKRKNLSEQLPIFLDYSYRFDLYLDKEYFIL